MSNHLGGVADVYDAMGDRTAVKPAMTEAMREQFEADAVEAFHNAYMAARMGSPRRAGATYAAVQAVVALTLRSPAVAELVAAGDFLAMNGTDGMVRRWEAAKAAINGAKP